MNPVTAGYKVKLMNSTNTPIAQNMTYVDVVQLQRKKKNITFRK